MIEAQAIRVPSACSPLEGVYLLAVLLQRQTERLDELRPAVAAELAESLDPLEADLRELHWRFRAILGGAEGGPWDEATLQALLLLSGVGLESVQGRARRADRLDRAEQTAAISGEVARQCRVQFAHSAYSDEFRLCQDWATELGRCLAHLRN